MQNHQNNTSEVKYILEFPFCMYFSFKIQHIYRVLQPSLQSILGHLHHSIRKCSTHWQSLSISPQLAPSQPQATTNLPSLLICLFWTCRISEITQYVVFGDWLFHLAYVFKVHSCCSLYQYFISFCYQIISHSMDMSRFIYPFIHQLMDIWVVSTFELLRTYVYMFLCVHIFSFLQECD